MFHSTGTRTESSPVFAFCNSVFLDTEFALSCFEDMVLPSTSFSAMH